jgi:hypothetical protein
MLAVPRRTTMLLKEICTTDVAFCDHLRLLDLAKMLAR